MTTEKDDDAGTSPEHSAEDLAAFEASFNGTPEKALSSTAAPAVDAAAASTDAPAADTKQEVAAKPEVEIAPTDAAPTAPSPKADDDSKAEMRKLHGRIGELNDKLLQLQKGKEAEGKPAVLTPLELKRTLSEYPELAGALQEDLAEAIANLRQPAAATAFDPKAVDAIVEKRIAAERIEQVADSHPTWIKDLWAAENQRTPEYEAWAKTLPQGDLEAFEQSNRPGHVVKKLNEFYAWRDKAAKAQTEKQSRLKAAVTPQGTPRAGPAVMSDEDAEKKAFEDAFNS